MEQPGEASSHHPFSRMARNRNEIPSTSHDPMAISQLRLPAHIAHLGGPFASGMFQVAESSATAQQNVPFNPSYEDPQLNANIAVHAAPYTQETHFAPNENQASGAFPTSEGLYIQPMEVSNFRMNSTTTYQDTSPTPQHIGLVRNAMEQQTLVTPQSQRTSVQALCSTPYGDNVPNQSSNPDLVPNYPPAHNSYFDAVAPPNQLSSQSASFPTNGDRNEAHSFPLYNQAPTRRQPNENTTYAGPPQVSNQNVVDLTYSPRSFSRQTSRQGLPQPTFYGTKQPLPVAQQGDQTTAYSTFTQKKTADVITETVELHTKSPNKNGITDDRYSQSIDIGSVDNNYCGGVNRLLHEDPIDLSNEANEGAGNKLKRPRPGERRTTDLAARNERFRIPSKKDNDTQCFDRDLSPSDQRGHSAGTQVIAFQDPLNIKPRTNQGPPPRPFPAQPGSDPPTPSRRRSNRLQSQSEKINVKSGAGSSTAKVLSANPPDDHQFPLGGLPKTKRGRKSNENTFMYSNRSNRPTAKRRRPDREKSDDFIKRESGSVSNVTRRKPSGTTRPGRGAKRKGRERSVEKRLSSQARKKPGIAKDDSDEDTEDEFSRGLNQRIMGLHGSEDTRRKSNSSPLSNTIGEDSDSDDCDLGAEGNELSSDEEGAAVPERLSQTARKRRKTAVTGSQDGNDSRNSPSHKKNILTRSRDPNDSDRENFMETRPRTSKNASKMGSRRKPNGKKEKERVVRPSSPINLISPQSSDMKQKSVRKSPRNTKKGISVNQKREEDSQDTSGDDFYNSPVNKKRRSKKDRGTTRVTRVPRSKEDEKDEAKEAVKMRSSSEEQIVDSAPQENLCYGSGAMVLKYPSEGSDSDSDSAEEFPSQEEGSQPIDLHVRVMKKRRKATPKVFADREFKKLSPDELTIIRIAFTKRYPAPPSNMQAQGRYEAAHGTEMTAGMVQETWKTELKPWSERWWKLYLDFNNVVREKKLAKPKNKDPTIKEREANAWVEQYYLQHGDARPTLRASENNNTA